MSNTGQRTNPLVIEKEKKILFDYKLERKFKIYEPLSEEQQQNSQLQKQYNKLKGQR